MNPLRSLQQPQLQCNKIKINSTNINHGLGIPVDCGSVHTCPTSRILSSLDIVPITTQPRTGVMEIEKAEYGANFLQLTPTASRFRLGADIIPTSVTPPLQDKAQLETSDSILLGRQPTLFTKNASPQRKIAELTNALGNNKTHSLPRRRP